MTIQRCAWRAHRFCARYKNLAALVLLIFSLTSISNTAHAQTCANHSGANTSCNDSADPGTTPSGDTAFRHVGNPVDVITGAKQQREIDFQAAGSPLHLSRYYYSARSGVNQGLGAGWRHSYQVKLVAVDENQLRIQEASGEWIDFYRIDASTTASIYMASEVSRGYIVNDAQPVWYLPDDRALRFNGSVLTQIDYPNDERLRLQYLNGRLHSVDDSKGRKLVFEYHAPPAELPQFDDLQAGVFPGFIKQIELPSGDVLSYGYDQDGNLINVSDANDNGQIYTYGLSEFPNHLTSIEQTRYTETTKRAWRYDGEGRVIRYEAHNPDESLGIEYSGVEGGNGIGETRVYYDFGKQQSYEWLVDSDGQSSRVSSVVTRDCEDCKPIRHASASPILQNAEDVLQLEAKRLSTTVQKGEANQQQPITDSLNTYSDIAINGVDHRFLIRVNRFGQVMDIEVGNTSLTQMQDQWSEGLIERCDAAPLFERSQMDPKPTHGCFEDIIFLIELHDKVEDEGASHNLSDFNDQLRSAHTSPLPQPCRIYAYRTCAELERSFELAQLSECSYDDIDFNSAVITPCGSKWQPVDPRSIGLSIDQFTHGSFASTLFHNASTGEYVLAMRGSNDFGDWEDNVLQGMGEHSPQYAAAVRLAGEVRASLPADAPLSTTGHSLGGGLATAAALSIGARATVFNPAALHPRAARNLGLNYGLSEHLIDVVTLDGDLLTAIQTPQPGQLIPRRNAPGNHTMIGPPGRQWITAQQNSRSSLGSIEGVVLHGIDAVLESEETMLQLQCGITPERA